MDHIAMQLPQIKRTLARRHQQQKFCDSRSDDGCTMKIVIRFLTATVAVVVDVVYPFSVRTRVNYVT